jgi:hypothetical protein
MKSNYFVVGAILLALLVAGVLFGTNFFTRNPFVQASSPEELLAEMSQAAIGGGFAVTFSEKDASRWTLANGHRLERFSVDSKDAAFARLSSSVPLDPKTWEWAGQGLAVTFPVGFNNATNGHKIEIGIVARRSLTNSSDAISVVYATQQAGNTGWHKITLKQDFELATFTFDVPKVTDGAYTHQPILVIHSDSEGRGRAGEILGVYVKSAPGGR